MLPLAIASLLGYIKSSACLTGFDIMVDKLLSFRRRKKYLRIPKHCFCVELFRGFMWCLITMIMIYVVICSKGSMLAVSVEEVATMAFMRLLNTHKTHFGNMSKPSHCNR